MEKRQASEQSSSYRLFCGKEECQPGHYFGPAVRPPLSHSCNFKGKGNFSEKRVTYTLKRGTPFLFPLWNPLTIRLTRRTPWSYAWVGFDGKACPEIFNQTVFSDSFIYQNPGSNVSALLGCMDRLLASFTQSHGRQLEPIGNLILPPLLYAGPFSGKKQRLF